MYIDFEEVLLFVWMLLLEVFIISAYKKAITPNEIELAMYFLILTTASITLMVYWYIRIEICRKREAKLSCEYSGLSFDKRVINCEKDLTLTKRQRDLLDQRESDINELMKIIDLDLIHPRYSSNKLYRRKEKKRIKRKLYDNIYANKKEYYLIKSNNSTK